MKPCPTVWRESVMWKECLPGGGTSWTPCFWKVGGFPLSTWTAMAGMLLSFYKTGSLFCDVNLLFSLTFNLFNIFVLNNQCFEVEVDKCIASRLFLELNYSYLISFHNLQTWSHFYHSSCSYLFAPLTCLNSVFFVCFLLLFSYQQTSSVVIHICHFYCMYQWSIIWPFSSSLEWIM